MLVKWKRRLRHTYVNPATLPSIMVELARRGTTLGKTGSKSLLILRVAGELGVFQPLGPECSTSSTSMWLVEARAWQIMLWPLTGLVLRQRSPRRIAVIVRGTKMGSGRYAP